MKFTEECEICMEKYVLELVYWGKLSYSRKNICFETLQNSDQSNNASGLTRGMSSNFWWRRSANHMKFTEECAICKKKYVFSKMKKIFTNAQNIGLSQCQSTK